MIRFFARWFFRSALVVLLGSAFFSHGSLSTVIAWAVCGYLLFRALPAVRQDVRKLWRFGRRKVYSAQSRF